MMARCTGKTQLHNLEPEDLRALTLATAEATDILRVGPHSGRRAAWHHERTRTDRGVGADFVGGGGGCLPSLAEIRHLPEIIPL